jgi:hypothetical protein
MTGAELKTRLGGLGLPPSWFAERMGKTMRTVVRWFDGDDIAPEVAVEIDKLSDQAVAEMVKMLDAINTDEGVITLKTYRTDSEVPASRKGKMPASWHRALTFRVREHLMAQGCVVTIEYK